MKTKDYNKFSFISTNRIVNKGLIKRLKKSITKLGYIQGRPILVNDKYQIIDGQNRFIACKELRLPIVYEVYKNTNKNVSENEVISNLNKNQLIWRLHDYIHHYAEQGIECYIKTREFNAKHNLSISNGIAICLSTNSDLVLSEKIRNGVEIKLNPQREEIAKFIKSCSDLYFYKTAKFVSAIVNLFYKSSEYQRGRLYKNRMIITQQPNMTFYLSIFSNIINKGLHVDKHIVL